MVESRAKEALLILGGLLLGCLFLGIVLGVTQLTSEPVYEETLLGVGLILVLIGALVQ